MRRGEQGQALLAVLLVLALLVILGTASLTLATYSKQAATGELARLQALYAANAGVERAMLRVRDDPGGSIGELNGLTGCFNDAGGNEVGEIEYVKVEETVTSGVYRVRAEASAGRAKKNGRGRGVSFGRWRRIQGEGCLVEWIGDVLLQLLLKRGKRGVNVC
ncbi:MAG TPA: hypothetical protein EYP63_04105 [Desulfotomaculum sp.]|nr:hypothetical protein [Desulfotomaculum sp.]